MSIKMFLDSLEGVPDTLANLYEKQADGKFRLKLDGAEDTGALKRAKDHEKAARKKAEDEARELREKIEALAEERDNLHRGAIPKGDVDKLEASWKEKLAAKEKELSDQISALQNNVQTMLVDNVAHSLASEISKSPALMIPHIKGRLAVDYVDGKPATRVLGADGSPSALTLEELKKEFVANPVFAPVIIASKASGGSSDDRNGGSSATGTKLDYATASPKELAAAIRAKKANGG